MDHVTVRSCDMFVDRLVCMVDQFSTGGVVKNSRQAKMHNDDDEPIKLRCMSDQQGGITAGLHLEELIYQTKILKYLLELT